MGGILSPLTNKVSLHKSLTILLCNFQAQVPNPLFLLISSKYGFSSSSIITSRPHKENPLYDVGILVTIFEKEGSALINILRMMSLMEALSFSTCVVLILKNSRYALEKAQGNIYVTLNMDMHHSMLHS